MQPTWVFRVFISLKENGKCGTKGQIRDRYELLLRAILQQFVHDFFCIFFLKKEKINIQYHYISKSNRNLHFSQLCSKCLLLIENMSFHSEINCTGLTLSIFPRRKDNNYIFRQGDSNLKRRIGRVSNVEPPSWNCVTNVILYLSHLMVSRMSTIILTLMCDFHESISWFENVHLSRRRVLEKITLVHNLFETLKSLPNRKIMSN